MYNQEEITHDFTTKGPFRDFAHAIVNRQQKLDEVFFNAVVERIKEFRRNEQSNGQPPLMEDGMGDLSNGLNGLQHWKQKEPNSDGLQPNSMASKLLAMASICLQPICKRIPHL